MALIEAYEMIPADGLLTIYSDSELVFQALRAGACGYLDKSASDRRVLDAIGEVRAGGAPMTSSIARIVIGSFHSGAESNLSGRELEVLCLLCRGSAYKDIADDLFISVGTVRHHIKNIYRKLQVHSKAQAVAVALKANLVDF